MKKLFVLSAIVFTSCCTKKLNTTQERYCIVVDKVRYKKHGALIKPVCQDSTYKGDMPWYRYPTPNIFKGDTVDVCHCDIITGPNF